MFESLDNMGSVSTLDGRIFWGGLYVPVLIWGLALVACVLSLKLQSLVIVGVALALSAANIVGYTKCSKEANAKMQAMMQQVRHLGLPPPVYYTTRNER